MLEIVCSPPTNDAPDIWRHDKDEEYHTYSFKHFSYDIEQPHRPSAPANEPGEAPASEVNHTALNETAESTVPPKNITCPIPPPTAPPTPTEETEPPCFPNLHSLIAEAQGQSNPPPSNAHPPASRPRYQNQTLTSALRATSKSPKARLRKRSVTFAELSDGEGSGRRERSLVRERAREIEKSLGKEDGESEEAVMSSSVISKESGDGYSGGSEGGNGEDSMVKSTASKMGSGSEVVED